MRRLLGDNQYEDVTPRHLRREPFGVVISRDTSECAIQSLKTSSISESDERPKYRRVSELPAAPVSETFFEPISLTRRLYLSSLVAEVKKFGSLESYAGKGKQRLDPSHSAVPTLSEDTLRDYSASSFASSALPPESLFTAELFDVLTDSRGRAHGLARCSSTH